MARGAWTKENGGPENEILADLHSRPRRVTATAAYCLRRVLDQCGVGAEVAHEAGGPQFAGGGVGDAKQRAGHRVAIADEDATVPVFEDGFGEAAASGVDMARSPDLAVAEDSYRRQRVVAAAGAGAGYAA